MLIGLISLHRETERPKKVVIKIIDGDSIIIQPVLAGNEGPQPGRRWRP